MRIELCHCCHFNRVTNLMCKHYYNNLYVTILHYITYTRLYEIPIKNHSIMILFNFCLSLSWNNEQCAHSYACRNPLRILRYDALKKPKKPFYIGC